jgi:hypothetical protein
LHQGPAARRAFTGVFHEGVAIGRHRLLQPCRSAPDEAFSDLLKKHGRPTDLKTALRESVKKEDSKRPTSKKGPSRS